MDLLSSACPQGAPDVQDGSELGRAQRALALVLAQAAGVEGVAAKKVHCGQLQGPPAERAPVILEHPHLHACEMPQQPERPQTETLPKAAFCE